MYQNPVILVVQSVLISKLTKNDVYGNQKNLAGIQC